MKVTMIVMNFKMGLIVYVNMKSQILAKSQKFDYENDKAYYFNLRTYIHRGFFNF